ncbi:hypothetical protein DL93DRAFT_2042337, partial [Clavulina sp. PMI_390]
IHICLFADIQGGAELKGRLIRAATLEGESGIAERERVNFAFINAALIISPLHLHTAIQQALLARGGGTLRTKSIHSEILYFLHPSHNISEAIRTFGVGKETKDVLVVRIGS